MPRQYDSLNNCPSFRLQFCSKKLNLEFFNAANKPLHEKASRRMSIQFQKLSWCNVFTRVFFFILGFFCTLGKILHLRMTNSMNKSNEKPLPSERSTQRTKVIIKMKGGGAFLRRFPIFSHCCKPGVVWHLSRSCTQDIHTLSAY